MVQNKDAIGKLYSFSGFLGASSHWAGFCAGEKRHPRKGKAAGESHGVTGAAVSC